MSFTRTAVLALVAAIALQGNPSIAEDIVALAPIPAVIPNTSVTAATEVNVTNVLALSRDEVSARFPMLSVAELEKLMFKIADLRSMERRPATDH